MSEILRPIISTDIKFRGYLPADRWTLCVGAGISRGIAPTWFDLARAVVSEIFGTTFDSDQFSKMVQDSGWSLDAWIQAAANEYVLQGNKIEKFKEIIESHLYSQIREQAKGLGLEKYLTNVLNYPKSQPKERIIEVCEFIQNSFPNCSLLGIANFLIDAAKSGQKPRAILTFNADTFLETLIDLILRVNHYKGPGPHNHPKYYYVSVKRPGSLAGDKIPIFHCHGSIAPLYDPGRKPSDSRDRLVFLEQEYLATPSSPAAWAETIFLFLAQSTKLAFVGMSMSDSDIRRWMSAINREWTKDMLIYNATKVNPEHIWLTEKPANDINQRLLLVSQQHLGIRPAWVTNWSELAKGLRNLCAIPNAV